MAIADITENESEKIEDAKEDYREEMCVIILKYDSNNQANSIADKIALANDKLNYFDTEYQIQHEDDEVDEVDEDEEVVEEPGFISEPFTCEYDRISYNSTTLSQSLRDFIFEDEFNNEPFLIGDYNKTPKYIQSDQAYYFVYKVSKPQYVTDYRNSEVFNQYILDQLVLSKLTATYINTEVTELRNSINLKIYDKEIGSQYKTNLNKDFEPEKKLSKSDDGEFIVATYKIDGETITVKADDLYEEMKIRFATQILIEKINIEALKTIPEIKLTKTEKNDILTQIKDYKTQYLQQPQPYTWPEHIALNFGVFSEAELADFIAAPTLTQRYVLGYEDYAGADPVTDEDIAEAYQAWFSIEASHILFTFDPEDDADKELARLKGEQVINGCTDEDENGDPQYREGITEDSCYIFYDAETPTNEDVPFLGLDEIKASQYVNTMKALAVKYSKDPSAAENSGKLGYFGPGAMVSEFENAAKEIASRIKEGGVPFTLLPVQSLIEREDGDINGFHVIYVSNSRVKTEQPTDMTLYDQYLLDVEDVDKDVTDIYTTEEITKFKAYKTFLGQLETTLEATHKKAENQVKQLALLRETLNVNIEDDEIRAVYENITAVQKAYTEDEEAAD